MFDLKEFEQEVFDPSYAKLLQLDRPIKPYPKLIWKIIHAVKVDLGHAGIIVFDKGTFDTSILEGMNSPQIPASSGWHIHGEFDAVNIARGSDVPSLLSTPEAVAKSVIEAIEDRMEIIKMYSNPMGRINAGVHDMYKQLVDTDKYLSIYEIFKLSRNQLNRYLDGRATLDELAIALNRVRDMFAATYEYPNQYPFGAADVFRDLLIAAQNGVPSNKVLSLSQRDYDGYLIPALVPHARAFIEGQILRPASSDAARFPADPRTGLKPAFL